MIVRNTTLYANDDSRKYYHGVESFGTPSFDNSTHVFSISSITYWYKGTKYITANSTTCDLDSYITLTANVNYVVYFDDATGTLKAATGGFNLKEQVAVATLFWNGSDNALVIECHNHTRDIDWHINAHKTIGARYESGLDLTYPNAANDALLQIESGNVWDEDINHTISRQTTMRGWYKTNATTFTFANYSLPYLGTSGQPQYLDTDTYTLTDVGSAAFANYWVYAMGGDTSRKIYIVPTHATADYNTIALARAEAIPNLKDLNLNPEMKLIYRFTYKGNGDYQEFVDYRTSSSLPGGGSASTTAAAVSFTPTGNISATTVQTAVEELDNEKLTNSMATNKLLGRGTTGTGVIEEITLGTNLSLSGTTLNATGGSGGHTIQDNGTDLTARANLDLRGGYNVIADDSTADATKLLLTNNLGKDWYINQNIYPALEWVWYHTDGYWYLVTMVLSQASSNVGNATRKFLVQKTKDWQTFSDVCNYENTSYAMVNPKICLDSNGNINVIAIDTNNIRSIFFNASDSYSATVTSNISQNTSYAIETTVSLNVSSDNKFGVAFFQKHSGSTSYSQLMYVERSAGTSGTWGTPEILGSTPVRAATVTSSGAPQLFFTSANEPIIAFLNNQSATSSKAAIAKKVSGSWTVYDDTSTTIYAAAMYSDSSIAYSYNSQSFRKFTYSGNSFVGISITRVVLSNYMAIDANDDIYGLSNLNALSGQSVTSVFYTKNDDDIFHRAIRPYFQIGGLVGTTTYSTFGIYTVIPYSRQRLTNAYHLVVRTDGAIYMEVI